MPNQKFNIFAQFNTLINILVIGTVLFTLTSTQAYAVDAESKIVEKSAAKGAEKTEREKVSFSISIDDEKGIEIKGLANLKAKLEGLKSLEDLEKLEGLEDLDKDLSKLKKLKVLKNLNVTIADDEGKKSVGDLSGLMKKARNYSFGLTLIALSPFLLIFAIVFLLLYFRHRSRQDSLATLRLMIENGQTISPEVMSSLNVKASGGGAWKEHQGHIVKGLKPIFWGIGLILVITFDNFDMDSWTIGIILIVVGLYHVTKSYLLKSQKNEQDEVTESKENSSNDSL